MTPLMLAAAGGHIEVVRLLVTSGTKVNASPSPWGFTPLGLASARGDVDIVTVMLHWKAEPTIETHSGHAPLLAAAAAGHTQVCAVLLEHGADVDASDERGITALMLAVERERLEVVRMLLGHMASVASVDRRSSSAFTRAIEAVLRADPQALHIRMSVSGHMSKYDGCTEIARGLAERRAAVDLADAAGQTPLLRAVRAQRTDVVVLLLDLGADKDFPVPALGGATVLLQAVRDGSKDMTQVLIMRGASVNRISCDGYAPVFVAAEMGAEDLVVVLLNAGASPHRRNPRTGETLVMMAAARGMHSVYGHLLSVTPVLPVSPSGAEVLDATTRTMGSTARTQGEDTETDEASDDAA